MAIVGAGPAGLECALTLAGRREVVLFDARDAIGGQLAVAGAAPNRSGWRALLDFYAAALERVELRLGTPVRGRPRRLRRGRDRDRQHRAPAGPAGHRARASSSPIGRRLSGRSLLVVDDGFGWWPCASAVELGVSAGFERSRWRRRAPPSGLAAARGPRAAARAPARRSARGPPFTALAGLGEDSAALRSTMSGPPSACRPTPSSSSASASRATGARWSRRGHRPRDRRRPRAAQGVARDRRGRAAGGDRRARPRAAARRRRRPRPDQAIRTSVLPIVSPASIRASASGARSRPSTIVSR